MIPLSAASWLPKRSRITSILFATVVCVLFLVTLRLTWSAPIVVSGAVLSVPLPSAGLYLREHNGCREYLLWGDPDFRFLSNGWVEIEQMGAAHLLAQGAVEILATTRKSTRWLTAVTYCAKSRLLSSG